MIRAKKRTGATPAQRQTVLQPSYSVGRGVSRNNIHRTTLPLCVWAMLLKLQQSEATAPQRRQMWRWSNVNCAPATTCPLREGDCRHGFWDV